MEQILGEVRDRVAEGAREITLLGQTVNSWHRNGTKGRDTNFADLLEEVGAVDGVERIRFMSPHPYYLTDRVIEAMATIPAVCESLHLPVQSGSDAILRKMQRNYTRQHYIRLIERMRNAMPGMTLSTDIIVGFPGETERDFHETLSLLEELCFDWGFIFKYSPREGTPAAGFDCHPDEIIEERHQRCLGVLERISAERRSKLSGTLQEVLVEEQNVGRTRTNYKVRINGRAAPGQLLQVLIRSAEHATLEGTLVDCVDDVDLRSASSV
jgi:tRNA-2-methylthio-N6-dimethylallyladenosine synthase